MFDIGWQEIFILAVIALIVIGPKDLPGAVRTITRGIRKARSLARDLRDGMDDVVREAEMEDFANTISGEDMDLTQKFKDAANIEFSPPPPSNTGSLLPEVMAILDFALCRISIGVC